MSNCIHLYGKSKNQHKEGMCDILCPECNDNNVEVEICFHECCTKYVCGSFEITIVCNNCGYYASFAKENHGPYT